MYSSDALSADILLCEMWPGLFMGGWPAAAHACRTEMLGPSVYVVNLTNGKPMLSKFGAEIKVDDDGSPEAMRVMEDVLATTLRGMKEAMDQRMPVLVHCSAGRQRSAAVVAAYLMKFQGWDLDSTITYMKSKKIDAFFPEVNFASVLLRFQQSLQ